MTITDRNAIERFLRAAERRIDEHKEKLPMRPQQARLTIAWLRALLDNPSIVKVH